MNIAGFALARLPRIEFGAGAVRKLPGLLPPYGKRFLLVLGRASFEQSEAWADLAAQLKAAGLSWDILRVPGEPSPELVDEAVHVHRHGSFQAVVGIGGGSVLDAAKAVAGLLIPGNSVMDHLEGVGLELPYRGPALPFIAVPTTAGTGSEATKNAVLSVHGENGFKKSFRDEQLVAQVALVDPDLLASCPKAIIAANGMDAFTQLLESYVSLKAGPLTDSLAWGGMKAARDGLLACHADAADSAARAHMAYAALVSGITLAQTGLGSVHSLAAPLGALFPIPHGVACGALVAEATRLNIEALQARAPDSPALKKYALAGRLLARENGLDEVAARTRLVDILQDWTARLELPRLGGYGVGAADVPRIVAHSRGSSMKTNPLVLSDTELSRLVASRI